MLFLEVRMSGKRFHILFPDNLWAEIVKMSERDGLSVRSVIIILLWAGVRA